MSNSVERALPPLDLTGSSSQVAEWWRQWKRSYQYYIDGKGITNASRKRAQLLYLAGMEVQDIFQDLPDLGPINAEEDNEYVVCLRKLDAYFRAVDNVPYERRPTGRPLTSLWFVYENKLVTAILAKLWRKICEIS